VRPAPHAPETSRGRRLAPAVSARIWPVGIIWLRSNRFAPSRGGIFDQSSIFAASVSCKIGWMALPICTGAIRSGPATCMSCRGGSPKFCRSARPMRTGSKGASGDPRKPPGPKLWNPPSMARPAPLSTASTICSHEALLSAETSTSPSRKTSYFSFVLSPALSPVKAARISRRCLR